MDRKTARGNRLGLLLIGLPLIALGGLALARGARLLPWTRASAREPLVGPPVRDVFARYDPQLWWVIAAGAIVLALFGLRWLLVQGRHEKLDDIRLENGPAGTTDVQTEGVTDMVAAEVGSHPSIYDARASLVGTNTRPAVRLRVTVAETAPMSAIRDQLGGVAISHMRQALETERLPAVAQLRLEPPHPGRTVV